LVILSDYLAPDNSNAKLSGFMEKPLPNFLGGKNQAGESWDCENRAEFSWRKS
jgi:hypothetical protein